MQKLDDRNVGFLECYAYDKQSVQLEA
jgi:hypothetical protein